MIEQRDAELAVPTVDIADKAMSLDASFHVGNYNKLMRSVYEFMKRRRLSVRTRTRKSQITEVTMQSVKQDFCRRLMTSYNGFKRNPRFLVNMDETAIYLNCSPNRTVHPTDGKAVSIIVGGISSTRFTLAVIITMDGTKLPLFVIFKGTLGDSFEKSLPDIIPKGVIGCVQRKGWIYSRTMTIWCNNVKKP